MTELEVCGFYGPDFSLHWRRLTAEHSPPITESLQSPYEA